MSASDLETAPESNNMEVCRCARIAAENLVRVLAWVAGGVATVGAATTNYGQRALCPSHDAPTAMLPSVLRGDSAMDKPAAPPASPSSTSNETERNTKHSPPRTSASIAARLERQRSDGRKQNAGEGWSMRDQSGIEQASSLAGTNSLHSWSGRTTNARSADWRSSTVLVEAHLGTHI